MRITFLGHAGLFVETSGGSILCDPWFNPAFFASWFPFPDNGGLDVESFASPDYLFVSHSHDDHFDERFLREHVSKDAVVVLPDFPTADHRRALERLGFSEFLETRNGVPVEIGELRLLTHALTAPTDGAIGDCGLAISDRDATIFNQNDSKPTDLAALAEFGPYDGHFVQFSGAIWYPMVYRLDADEKRELGRRKRFNQMERASRFVREIGARHVFPFAGPPCFLDEELFHLNDLGTDEGNIFADQTVALAYMEEQGLHNGHLLVPGSSVTLRPASVVVEHPADDDAVRRPFRDKLGYLREYQARRRDDLEREKAAWPDAGSVDVLAELAAWWEPLLRDADHVCRGVGAPVLLDLGDTAVVVDFPARKVVPFTGQHCPYRYYLPAPLVVRCIQERQVDWLNALFLSCRFEAERDGSYNEFIYNFFRSLSPERMAYTERYYEERRTGLEVFEAAGYEIQRRCPHLNADLTRFGTIEDGILTCALHGWRFELETGRCLTSADRTLHCRRLELAGANQPEQPDEDR
jgi:UDP-MurNAc hydroxylase